MLVLAPPRCSALRTLRPHDTSSPPRPAATSASVTGRRRRPLARRCAATTATRHTAPVPRPLARRCAPPGLRLCSHPPLIGRSPCLRLDPETDSTPAVSEPPSTSTFRVCCSRRGLAALP
ncbi:hypothetical protein ZWY2020_058733 [Hordeum vulgare]|nr:hypothetical protein ZWY2020_058733 [Hordeum vulgare]